MYLVDEINFPIAFSKLILCINKNQPTLCCNLLSTVEKTACIILHNGIILSRDYTLGYYLLTRDVHVMSLVRLCRRSDDRLWEALVLSHTIGESHSTYLTDTALIVSPSGACQVSSYNHLYTETLTRQTDRDLRVWSSQLPVRTDITCRIEHL